MLKKSKLILTLSLTAFTANSQAQDNHSAPTDAVPAVTAPSLPRDLKLSNGTVVGQVYGFTKKDNSIVELTKDKTSNLVWSSESPTTLTYKEAVEYCESLNKESIGGFNSWRLPTAMNKNDRKNKSQNEFILAFMPQNLIQPKNARIKDFLSLKKDFYWTSTKDSLNPEKKISTYYPSTGGITPQFSTKFGATDSEPKGGAYCVNT